MALLCRAGSAAGRAGGEDLAPLMRADGNAIGDRVPLQLIHWVFIRLVQCQIAVLGITRLRALSLAIDASKPVRTITNFSLIPVSCCARCSTSSSLLSADRMA